MTIRKTISMPDKLGDKIFNLDTTIMKTTKQHWSESKLMSALMDFALNHGANAETIAKIYGEEK